ncbi:hypothetical protein ACJD0Z_17025 [Flavobacteriaceae bacterium M23B6Z8]
MKNYVIIFLIGYLLMSSEVTAQKTKKVYLDTDDTELSRRDYKKKYKKAGYQVLDLKITDTDSLEVRKLFWREHQGALNAIALDQLKQYLRQLSGKELPEANYIAINYYPGPDKCNKGGYNEYELEMMESYELALETIGNASQYYIHNKETMAPTGTKKDQSLADQTNLFKNVFFPHHFPCKSFVVIHPDGRYVKYYGEHSLQAVVDVLQADWDQDFFWE